MSLLGSILIIDDNPLNVRLARDVLEEAGYEVMETHNAGEGIEVIKNYRPEVVIMDIMMPGLAGDEATRLIKENTETRQTRIIIVSAKAGPDDIVHGFRCHADDYVTKPYYPQVLMERVKAQMLVHQTERVLENQKEKLENKLMEQSLQLEKSYESIYLPLAGTIESRNPRAAGRMERTGRLTEILVRELRENGKYKKLISDEFVDIILWASRLHDIGWIGVPDSILNARSRTPQEQIIFQTHTVLGGEIFENAIRMLKSGPPVQLAICGEIARHHHERFDGWGYPDGLSGSYIPLSARLVALAACYEPAADFDIFSNTRPADIHSEIVRAKGTLFDPVIVDAYLANRDAFEKATIDTE